MQFTVICRQQEDLTRVEVVTTTHTGSRGRPQITINPEILQEAVAPGRRISQTELARSLGIHRHTLRKQLQGHGLSRPTHSIISDEDLDALLTAYREIHPSLGRRYVLGFLQNNGLRIQWDRVSASLRRVDGLRQVLRNHHTLDRHEYTVPYSNYLWHIDGHHKLIRWGFVIHGGADGNDRTVSA